MLLQKNYMKNSSRIRIVRFLLLLLPLLLSGCQKEQEEIPDFKILVIGNSLSDDAFSYVPCILHEVLPDLNVKVCVLYSSGCRTESHYKNIINDEEAYNYHSCTSKSRSWSTKKPYSALKALKEGDWDLILTNSFSHTPSYYDELQPYLNDLIVLCHQYTKPSVPVLWIQTPSHAGTYKFIAGKYTSNQYFYEEVKVCLRIIAETAISGIIPCGTAIQNARNTDFNEFGDGGELTYDTLHLQEGVPRLIDAFVCSQYLLDNYLGGGSISGVTFFPDEEFLSSWKSLGRKGSPVGMTRSNVEKCKQIALKSIEHPFILFE